MTRLREFLSVASFVLGNVGLFCFVAASLFKLAWMAYEAWNVWAAIAVLSSWPITVPVGSVVAVLGGVWQPLLLLGLAALSAASGWLLCLLLGWR